MPGLDRPTARPLKGRISKRLGASLASLGFRPAAGGEGSLASLGNRPAAGVGRGGWLRGFWLGMSLGLAVAAPIAAETAAALIADADAALAQADRGLAASAGGDAERRLAALDRAKTAAEQALAAMRAGLREAASREAQLSEGAEAARDGSQLALALLAARARAPLAAQAAQPAGPLAAARGAWLTAALGPGRAAQAGDLAAAADDARRAEGQARGAWARMRAAREDLDDARRPIAAAARRNPDVALTFAPPRLREARAALAAFAEAAARAAAAGPDPAPSAPPPRGFVPGALPLPAPGRILARYGEFDAFGQRNEGLEIGAPEWARPRSPFLASVRYVGPVGGRRLGVALEPAPGRLLILAGLAAITVEAGEVVRAGQPVGQLAVIDAVGEEFLVEAPAEGGALSRAMLYVEVREDGAPVPPANWFALPQGRAGTP